MNRDIPVVKDGENELPIPTEWRTVFVKIIDAIRIGKYVDIPNIKGVRPISKSERKRIDDNIKAYGDPLTILSDDAWKTSVYMWMDGYWEVLIDLSTLEEDSSDLVMFVKVYEETQKYKFIVSSIHVP